MSSPAATSGLVLITSYDALMADGRRIVWQSFRPANAAAGTKPTVYFTTLASSPDEKGTTLYDLATIGVQARTRDVEIKVLAGDAVLTVPGQEPLSLDVGVPMVVPARSMGDTSTLTVLSETCSLQVVPVWITSAASKSGGEAETGNCDLFDPVDPSGPPPPFPGGSDGD